MPLYSQARPGGIPYLLGELGKRRVFPTYLTEFGTLLTSSLKKRSRCVHVTPCLVCEPADDTIVLAQACSLHLNLYT